MQTFELPVESMLPRVLLARYYDSVAMQYETAQRRAESWELSFYLENSGVVLIGDTAYPVHTGDVRFVAPGTLLSSIPDFRCYTVYFDFGEPGTVCKNQILDGIPPYFHTTGELHSAFEEIVRCYESAEITARLRQNALLLSLLADLFETIHSGRQYCAAVRQCIEYIQTHFAENITLETLGALSGYSKLHLLRLFEQDTGQTPHKWLRAIRMSHARRLLTETDLTLDGIAAACGFASVSHFKVLFREETRFTPGAYRKNARQG